MKMNKLDDIIINEIWHFINRPEIRNDNENLNSDLQKTFMDYNEYDDSFNFPYFFKEEISKLADKYIHQRKLGE